MIHNFFILLPVISFWMAAGGFYAINFSQLTEKQWKLNGDLTVTKMVVRMLQLNVLHVVSTHAGLYLGTLGDIDKSLIFRWWTLPVGMFFMDTIQYFMHRAFHTFPFLYKYHKVHHELKSLHAFGSLYNSIVEVIITGAGMGLLFYNILGYSLIEFSILSSISFIATIVDHIPIYGKTIHWVHHNKNINSNFQQPFFNYWDKLLGTYCDPKQFY